MPDCVPLQKKRGAEGEQQCLECGEVQPLGAFRSSATGAREAVCRGCTAASEPPTPVHARQPAPAAPGAAFAQDWLPNLDLARQGLALGVGGGPHHCLHQGLPDKGSALQQHQQQQGGGRAAAPWRCMAGQQQETLVSPCPGGPLLSR